jgi:hypothetical protein
LQVRSHALAEFSSELACSLLQQVSRKQTLNRIGIHTKGQDRGLVWVVRGRLGTQRVDQSDFGNVKMVSKYATVDGDPHPGEGGQG